MTVNWVGYGQDPHFDSSANDKAYLYSVSESGWLYLDYSSGEKEVLFYTNTSWSTSVTKFFLLLTNSKYTHFNTIMKPSNLFFLFVFQCLFMHRVLQHGIKTLHTPTQHWCLLNLPPTFLCRMCPQVQQLLQLHIGLHWTAKSPLPPQLEPKVSPAPDAPAVFNLSVPETNSSTTTPSGLTTASNELCYATILGFLGEMVMLMVLLIGKEN